MGDSERECLWAESATEAFVKAIEAQTDKTPWKRLLRQAMLHRQALANRKMPEDGDSPDAVVVAGMVLSVPRCGYSPESHACTPRAYLCVSLGSGTRCVGTNDTERAASTPRTTTAHTNASPSAPLEAFVVRDGHAEVLARRGLCAAVLAWIAEEVADGADQSQPRSNPFLHCCKSLTGGEGNGTEVTFAQDVRVTLVSTHWMCGSVALAAAGETGGRLLLQTPLAQLKGLGDAESAVDAASSMVAGHRIAAHKAALDAHAAFQHSARLKPGKGHRSLSMSCSDKVWRWGVRGVLPKIVQERIGGAPLRLSYILVATIPSLGDAPHACDHAAESPLAVEAASRATASLVAKSRSLLMREEACILRPPPTVSLCSLPLQYVQGDDTIPRPSTANDAGDSGFSRAAWLSTLPISLVLVGREGAEKDGEADGQDACSSVNPRKRLRLDETVRPAAHTVAGAQPRACFQQAVFNMKAGLPQGMSMASLRRHSAPAVTKFPLSQAWVAHEVAGLPSPPRRAEAPMALWLHEMQRDTTPGYEAPAVPPQSMLWTCKHHATTHSKNHD